MKNISRKSQLVITLRSTFLIMLVVATAWGMATKQDVAGVSDKAGPEQVMQKSETIVNINQATEVELVALPGIGPVMAKKIIAWRAENGPFKSLEDLKKVNGIGDKKFEKLKPLIQI